MVQIGSAIRCQQCSGFLGTCDGLYDNGETVECPDDQDHPGICFYMEFCKHYCSASYFIKSLYTISLDYTDSYVKTIRRDCAKSYFDITDVCDHAISPIDDDVDVSLYHSRYKPILDSILIFTLLSRA